MKNKKAITTHKLNSNHCGNPHIMVAMSTADDEETMREEPAVPHGTEAAPEVTETKEESLESASSSEDEEDEEDEEEDEVPPLLKYCRLGSKLPKTFFTKELISSSLITDTVLAFGTSSGLLIVTDTNFQIHGTLKARKSPILSIHYDGHSNLAAASMDGTILITSLQSLGTTGSAAYDLKTSVYSVVLNGNYKETKSFIYGTKKGDIIISTLNWLGTRQERVISSDFDPIVKLDIIGGRVLIWVNDKGITFYDLLTDEKITTLAKPKALRKYPAELVWPKMTSPDRDRIIVGWVNHIWSIKIDGLQTSKETSPFKISSAMSSFSKPLNNVPEIHVTVEYQYSIEDGLIAGIGTFKDDSIIILTIDENSNDRTKDIEPPELRIINPITHEEISTDEVLLKGYKGLRCNDYQLGQHVGKNSTDFFLICSTDGIMATEFDLKGRYEWYLSREKYLPAWEISEHLIDEKERCEVGIKQVEKYLDDGNWDQSASFLKIVLSSVEIQEFLAEKWDQWSSIFIHAGKFEEIANILPVENYDGFIKQDAYNKVLEHFLEHDEDLFFQYIHTWNIENTFQSKHITDKLEQYLEIYPDHTTLRRSLADLYLRLKEHIPSIKHYIELKDPLVVDLIFNNHLLNQFINDLPTIVKFVINEDNLQNSPIEQLQEISSSLISLLVENRHEVSPSTIIQLLNKNDLENITFLYLKQINKEDPYAIESYETEMVSLYSKFQPQYLLPYLKRKTKYDIDRALEITRSKGLYKELVYLLGKVGKIHEAMYLIIDKMDDPQHAIEFATEHKNQELWDIFLSNGIKKPNFINVLIKFTGILFDSKILKEIPENMEIDDLQESLIRITQDNELNLTIQRGILKILEMEGVDISNQLNEMRIKGKCVDQVDLFAQYESVILKADGTLKPFERAV